MRNFYKNIDLNKVVEPYQNAFAGWPWFEVSKCEGKESQRCNGGFSPGAVGEDCAMCTRKLQRPAYEPEEVMAKFQKFEELYDALWYLEEVDDRVALACFGFRATAKQIFNERYKDVLAMEQWLINAVGDEEIVWLDEVFADKTVRESGNLNGFAPMVSGLASQLQLGRVAYRTINPAMLRVPERDFGDGAKTFVREIEVPDRRDFITINVSGE
jgi:hypothetical protein